MAEHRSYMPLVPGSSPGFPIFDQIGPITWGVWLSGKSGGLLTRVSVVPVFSGLIARIVYSGHAGSSPAAPLTIGM